jgi:8-oxo-dGTP pyrophosphatase MutT (NUDIX family)
MEHPKNIFQPGLIRGQKRLAHDPEKRYAYVEHPTEGWRVYLRSCGFLYLPGDMAEDPSRFIVVKKMGASANGKNWEPPKGQMEGKDILPHATKPILRLLEENVRREISEEAHINKIRDLKYSGLVFEGREHNYPPNTYFQYHIFTGHVSYSEYARAQNYFQMLEEHPEILETLTRDRLEKDAIQIYDGPKTKMFGRWSPKIVRMYLDAVSGAKGA